MKPKVIQIKEGFVRTDKKSWISSCSSVTLIKSEKNILVDTGGRGDHKEIFKNLNKEGLKPENIDIVINTHLHLDHIWNNAFFENATFINSYGHLDRIFHWHKLPFSLCKGVEIIETKGHTNDSCSVIVKTSEGVYAIVGDLWLKTKKEAIPTISESKKEVKKNREFILGMADYIIPGHGKMFKVKRS